MQKSIIMNVWLLIFSNTLIFAEMLFNDIKEEIKSPYSSGVSPYYSSSVNDSYSPRNEPILSEEESKKEEETLNKTRSVISNLEEESQKILKPNQTRVLANFQKNVDDSKKEMVKDETYDNISQDISTNKNDFTEKESTDLKVEIRPSSNFHYPSVNEATISEKTGISQKDTSQMALLKTKNNTEAKENLNQEREIKAPNNDPNAKEAWFILIQTSPKQENLIETQKKIKSFLSQKVPLNIHIDDSYNLLLAGPVNHNNVGMLLKLIQFNGYPQATAILNK